VCSPRSAVLLAPPHPRVFINDDHNIILRRSNFPQHGMASEAPPTAPAIASADVQIEYGSDLDHDLLFAVDPSAHPPDTRSDYGSEFDTDTEQILAGLLTGLAGSSGKSLVLESIVEDDNKRRVAHLPKCSSQNSSAHFTASEGDALEKGEVDGDTRISHTTSKAQ
jgi:hypothetical protein